MGGAFRILEETDQAGPPWSIDRPRVVSAETDFRVPGSWLCEQMGSRDEAAEGGRTTTKTTKGREGKGTTGSPLLG